MTKKPEIENDTNDVLDVTVCLLSFERPRYLAEAIDSVLSQTRRPREFTVLDSGSGEEVVGIANRYRDRRVLFEGSDVPRDRNWNFERAFNRARTKYFTIMHDDDRMCPDFLAKQVDYLDKHPDTAGIFCNCHVLDSLGKRNGILKPLAWDKVFNSSAEVALVYARGSCLPYPTGVYRTEAVRRVPMCKEYGKVADVAFMCDLADRGGIAYQKFPLYEYRLHGGQDSTFIPSEVLAELDGLLFDRINRSPSRFDTLRWHIYRKYAMGKRIGRRVGNFGLNRGD